jgi:hypothetical protein
LEIGGGHSNSTAFSVAEGKKAELARCVGSSMASRDGSQ